MTDKAMTLERLEQLKRAEYAVYLHIEDMFQRSTYTKRERKLFRRLIDLGNWQLGAACSWFEYDLMRAPHELHHLEYVIHQWDHLPHSERPAITREAVADRLTNLRTEIKQKEVVVNEAKKRGYFWSIVPLLEFFDLTEEERVGKSCYPLLPNLMQKAYFRMQTPKQHKSKQHKSNLMANIKRLRLRVAASVVGGEFEIEIETHELRDSGHE